MMTKEFDTFSISTDEIRTLDALDGDLIFSNELLNLGTIHIKCSDPAITSVKLVTPILMNEGKIICSVPKLEIHTNGVYGGGEIHAPIEVAVISTQKNLSIIGGTFRSPRFTQACDGRLDVRADCIEGKVELTAHEVSYGVNSGNLCIEKQTVTGDPIYYNKGGDLAVNPPPSNGSDIMALARGNITTNGLDSSGGALTDPGRIILSAGYGFLNETPGTVILGCVDCVSAARANPDLESNNQVDTTKSITVTGDLKGKSITLGAGTINVSGNIEAVEGNTSPFVLITAANSVNIEGTIETDALAEFPSLGSVGILSPHVSVAGKITSDHIFVATKTGEGPSGSGTIELADIEARYEVAIYAGDAELAGDNSFVSTILDSCSIATGEIKARTYICLVATGEISTGDIKLLHRENEEILPHNLRIHANIGADDAPILTIGEAIKSILVEGTTDITLGTNKKTGTILLSNGINGDIALDGNAIAVSNEGHGTPSLIVSAPNGQIYLKGNLSFDGTTDAPSGSVILIADKLAVSTSSSITTNSRVSVAEEIPPFVKISVSEIEMSGDLTIECEGNENNKCIVVPKDSSDFDPLAFHETQVIRPNEISFDPSSENVVLLGDGALSITSKGKNAKIEIFGKIIEMDAGNVTLTTGGETTEISIKSSANTHSSTDSLKILGAGLTVTSRDPDSGKGGTITIETDQISIGAATHFDCSSLSDVAGSIFIIATEGVIATTSMGHFNADCTGRGGGTVEITAKTNIQLKGEVDTSSLSSDDGGAIKVSAQGSIELSECLITSDSTTGNRAGEIHIEFGDGESIKVGTLSASSTSDTDGGTILIEGVKNGNMNLDAKILRTSTNEVPSGSISLMVFDENVNRINVIMPRDGELCGILTGKAHSFSLISDMPSPNFCISEILATEGDLFMGFSSASPALRLGVAPANPKIRVIPNGKFIGYKGLAVMTHDRIINDGIIQSAHKLTINTKQLTNNQNIEVLESDGELNINLPGDSNIDILKLDGNNGVLISYGSEKAINISNRKASGAQIIVSGMHQYIVPSFSGFVNIRIGSSPILIQEMGSGLVLTESSKITMSGRRFNVLSSEINIAPTAEVEANDLLWSFFTLVNEGQITGVNALAHFDFSNTQMEIFGNGIIQGQNLSVEIGKVDESNIAQNLHIDGQRISAERVNIFARAHIYGPSVEIFGATSVVIGSIYLQNDGAISAGLQNGEIYLVDAGFEGTGTIIGTGSLKSHSIQIDKRQKLSIEQEEVAGLITSRLRQGLDLKVHQGNLKLGSTIFEESGNLNVHNLTGEVSVQRNSVFWVTGNITFITGSIPTDFTSMEKPEQIFLWADALNFFDEPILGNVFFGTSLLARGQNHLTIYRPREFKCSGGGISFDGAYFYLI